MEISGVDNAALRSELDIKLNHNDWEKSFVGICIPWR